MPKKHRTISGAGPTSILELKAEMYKSQGEAKLSNAHEPSFHLAKAKAIHVDLLSRKNSGVEGRPHRGEQPHSPPQHHQSAAASPAAPPSLNDPPLYAEMIYAAITALKKKGGSSKIAIGKYIEQTYSNLPVNHSTLLSEHLLLLKNTRQLRMVKRSYKFPVRKLKSTRPAG